MKCVILAAGEGKRMHPLTYTRPKVMLEISGKPILEWNLLSAIAAGLSDFIIVVGYKAEMVRAYFGDGKKWNVSITYVNQGKALGTAHAIGIVEPFVDNCIVLCGDTIFGSADIKHVIKSQKSLGTVEVDHPQNYGIVEIRDNKIIKIYEKMKEPFTNIINAGIYHFNKEIFESIKQTKQSVRGEYEITDSINLFCKHNQMHTVALQEWRDVVYPWHLLEANEEKLQTIEKKIKGTIEDNVTIQGKVIVGNNTIIRSGSYIQGPVVIGSDCNIGPNCYIRPSTAIGDNCHIGNACEIKNSILMNNTNVPHQNYVGDSIIGYNCNLGAGSKIANLRLDKKNISLILNGTKIDTARKKFGAIIGDNVQIGINATINVGTIIGNNCFIGQAASVKGEINPNSKLF
ncbi:MAG: sugar phosphate nucleotidyltransferase [Thermoplasmatota archaeon]